LRPFKSGDVSNNALTRAREKKEEKYGAIVDEAKGCLDWNKEEIAIKYKASKISVECHYIIISNLGMVPKRTETDLCRLLKDEGKDKPRYARMWLKRMVNQVLRGSFECYINAGKEITDIDHVVEVNHNIANADDSINMNLWALNEKMGYDAHIKEKLDIKKLKRSIPEEKLKNFIELPNGDEDVVLKKESIDMINNNPPQEESNIVTIDEEKEMNDLFMGRTIRAAVDVSSKGVTENEDIEAESEENDAVLVGDGEPKEMRK
jgi:hypothetical protein